MPFVVHVDDRPVGSTRYLNVEPFHRRAEIGWTWLERAQWGTGANIETKYLLLDERVRRAGARCASSSRRTPATCACAARCSGSAARFEGIFRKHMVLPDSIRDSAWYAIVDDDWPRVKAMLEAKIERHARVRCAVRRRRRAASRRAGRRRRAGDPGAAGRAACASRSAATAGRGSSPPTTTRAGSARTRSRRARASCPADASGSPVDVARSYLGDAVSLGRDDRARASTAPASSTWPTAGSGGSCRATPTSRRTPASRSTSLQPGDLVTYGERAGRPHRLLAGRRADPPLDGPGRRDRRRRGAGARVPARAAPQARPAVITWATSDGREEGGDQVVPAASTIKIFVASAFWRSSLDPGRAGRGAAVPWSVADRARRAADARATVRCSCWRSRTTRPRTSSWSGSASTRSTRRRPGSAASGPRCAGLMMAAGPGEPDLRPRPGAGPRGDRRAEGSSTPSSVAHDSELPLRLHGRDVLVKTGEIWPRRLPRGGAGRPRRSLSRCAPSRPRCPARSPKWPPG